MNDFNLSICQKIIKKIKTEPLYECILNPPDDFSGMVLFSMVEEKLFTLQYVTIYDFEVDFNSYLFDLIDFYDEGSPEKFVVTDFLKSFQYKIFKAPKNETDIEAKKIKKLLNVIHDIISIMETHLKTDLGNKEIQKRSPSSSFSSLIKQEEFEDLQKKINQIQSPEIQWKIVKILMENIPNLEFNNTLEIDKSMINHKCWKSLKSFISSLKL